MTIPKQYFHDRLVLLLLALNSVLGVIGVLIVLFQLDSSRGSVYIIEFRTSLGIGEFENGTMLDMLRFIAFQAVSFLVAVVLSIRTYLIRRHLATTVLSMGVLLSVLGIIVSQALLWQR